MQRIIQILFDTLPEATDVCSAAEFLLPYIREDIVTAVPSVLGQQVALRSQLSLLETFTLIRTTHVQSADISYITASSANETADKQSLLYTRSPAR